MSGVDSLAATLPECCKDARMNLSSVLRSTALTPAVARSVALAAAYFVRCPRLSEALLADGRQELSPADVDDARAAASLMGMTTVYYRFRHLVGKPVYSQLRPNLRMNRMASPATTKKQFELCAMGCAALAGCEVCLRSHEESLVREGMTEEQIHEAVRIASAVNGFAVALEVGGAAST